ncbi:hypothetical protein EYF80_027580 [Liparis tanakae]|uniref:Uncharacterized protein n=1 Tax=Liparis tanakae TaxID=230148 RepID=A0A4Z2H9K8_9TELE|nr:hypothetical protein EYF80_027580 [Liparis tanakae]
MLENKTTESSPQSSSDGGGASAAESGTATLPITNNMSLLRLRRNIKLNVKWPGERSGWQQPGLHEARGITERRL